MTNPFINFTGFGILFSEPSSIKTPPFITYWEKNNSRSDYLDPIFISHLRITYRGLVIPRFNSLKYMSPKLKYGGLGGLLSLSSKHGSTFTPNCGTIGRLYNELNRYNFKLQKINFYFTFDWIPCQYVSPGLSHYLSHLLATPTTSIQSQKLLINLPEHKLSFSIKFK